MILHLLLCIYRLCLSLNQKSARFDVNRTSLTVKVFVLLDLCFDSFLYSKKRDTVDKPLISV